MKDFKTKPTLEKWHLYLLGLVLINFVIGQVTGYGLNNNLTFILKAVLYLSGILLFFKTLRPFRQIAVYFSFYAISAIIAGLFFLFGGIFLAVLSSLALYAIAPKQIVYKTGTIKVYDRFQGFLSRCCSYEVVEPKLYVFEKHLGYINTEGSFNADKDELSLQNNTIIYKHQLENYDYTEQIT